MIVGEIIEQVAVPKMVQTLNLVQQEQKNGIGKWKWRVHMKDIFGSRWIDLFKY